MTISLKQLFVEFMKMGLSGFGGVLPFARHALVERTGWMSEKEFTESLAIGQAMPGPNIVNVSLMFGYRRRGLWGALAAVSGLLLPPMLALLVFYFFYRQFEHYPVVRGMLQGVLAVSAGLMLGSGLKMAKSLLRSGEKLLHAVILALAAYVGIVVLGMPLAILLAVLLPVTLLWAMRHEK
ncbi:MAG: hypothetical protein RLZZ502_112 [Pseudomonadota bacterium]